MKRLIPLAAACLLALAGTAQAHGFPAGSTLLHSTAFGHLADVAQPSCPAGVPVQTITVVNQANVRPVALARVERATVEQSLQLRAAWGTPCVRFGPEGWEFDLDLDYKGAPGASGAHNEQIADVSCDACSHQGRILSDVGPDQWTPYAWVNTYAQLMPNWSVRFSHEMVEMLVNSYPASAPRLGAHGNLAEVGDPVDGHSYALDGVLVQDFVFPSYESDGAAPYDRLGVLSSAS